ncbi:unnamed protein product [Peronospora belbahrii]|uniref:Fanconi Anaemia group E protein C-terminal domain-containing protein n=1 Tax=Peronospora belbahrii TaxID=622444 RepID=A0ABN8CJV4_9STRA|nr:unnamed protein product [Peronospora belbahrii]
MVAHLHFLVFLAQSKGAIGVHRYLEEHHQQVPNILQELSATVVLRDDREEESNRSSNGHSNDKAVEDVGIGMEQLPLRAQREIWSALASNASRNEAAVVNLARAFLRATAQPRRHENDAVCISLARIVLSQVTGEQESEEAHGSTSAFRRRMRRLTLGQVQFPLLLNRNDDVQLVDRQGMSLSSMAMQSPARLNKRYREKVSEDPWPCKTEQNIRENTPTPTLFATKLQERPLLTKEMEDRASGLSKLLAQLPRFDADATIDDVATRTFDMLAEVVNDVHTTYAANEQSFQYLCKLLRMDSTSDEVLARITRYASFRSGDRVVIVTLHPFVSSVNSALVDANWSSRYAAIFLETTVLPKIRAADSVISRVLLQTALRFGSVYTRTLLDSLLLPLLLGDKDTMIGPAQAEAITRILRSSDTVPTDQLNEFVLAALTVKNENNSTPHLFSNESALLVFQNILNTKPALSALTVEKFVGACEAVLERPEAEQLRGSLKFATVVFTLISKYPQQCASHVEILETIATQLTSIMAKTTLRSLQKLKNDK